MDKLVFDVETKNTFADVGGQQNIKDLDVSFVGVYSYNRNEYLSFHEHQLEEMAELFKRAGYLIGFNIKHFDIPVLAKYCNFNLSAIPQLDLFEIIENSYGRRIGLDVVAHANLGVGKSHAGGLEAIRLYKEGKLDELAGYCLQDVKITKELYELAKKQRTLVIPDKFTDEKKVITLDAWEEPFLATPQLF